MLYCIYNKVEETVVHIMNEHPRHVQNYDWWWLQDQIEMVLLLTLCERLGPERAQVQRLVASKNKHAPLGFPYPSRSDTNA